MNRLPTLLSSLAAGCGIALLSACSGGGQPPAPPPPEVDVITVRAQPVPNIIELPGRIQAIRTSEVRARVDGIVQRRLYTEGTDVRAGQPLFAIDPRELRANQSAALAALARAQANAANAQQDVSRYQGLVKQQAISQQEYDGAVARLRTAQADVAQARAQVDRASLTLSYATVTAPISGRASIAQVTEGALVSAAAGTLLTTIEQMSPVYVNFGQSSSDLLALRRNIASGALGLPSLANVEVRLTLEDGTPYALPGRINFQDLAIGEATGTAALRAEFPNPARTLLPGQFVRAHINAGVRQDGIVVPQRAVRMTPAGGSVLVVGGKNIVEQRNVRLGSLEGRDWIILDGLKPGEKVIVNGIQKARPGAPVKISAQKPAAPKPAKTSGTAQ